MDVDLQILLNEIATIVRPLHVHGRVADYIPALAKIDSDKFAMAIAGVNGEMYTTGDSATRFSLQSVTKVFSLALVLAQEGDSLWQHVHREPSGNPFNSLVQLEYENGIPRNPFINAGALVVTDRLLSLTGDAWLSLREFMREESGSADVDCDLEVAASEAVYGHRNAALAHFMASYGNLNNPVEKVLQHYFRHCALAMSCAELARAGLFLARHGLRADGSRLFSRSVAKRINSIMLTCGTYDAAGEFAYRVGLPGKSGVGGGVLAIIPGKYSVAVWGPALDSYGNSVTGVSALDELTTRTGWSVF